MKYTITLLIAMSFQFGNTQAYKEKFKADICNCLDGEMENRRQIRNAFDTCFNKNLPTYATIIDASLGESTPALRYQKGQLRRAELKLQFVYELVYSCDLYFQELEAERQRLLATGRSRTYPSDLEKWDQVVAMRPNQYSYIERAKVHFFLGNLKEAEADVRKSLEVNLSGKQGLHTQKEIVLLAWILEEQKRYKEAVSLYNDAYFGVYDTKTPILKAIAHRKAGGKHAIAMPIENKSVNKEARETSIELNASSRRRSRAEESRKIESTNRMKSSRAEATKKPEEKTKVKSDNLRDLFKTKKTKPKTKKDNG